MTERTRELEALAAAKARIVAILTAAIMVVYFGFILLVAYARDLLGRQLVSGLSLGTLLGVLVIFSAWSLIAIYVMWANRHYDMAIARLRSQA